MVEKSKYTFIGLRRDMDILGSQIVSTHDQYMQIVARALYNALPEYRAIVDHTIAEISKLVREYQEGETQEE